MEGKTMKAAYYDVPGGPEVLSYTEVETPVCPEDGVLLRVEAISIEGGVTPPSAVSLARGLSGQALRDALGLPLRGEMREPES